MSDIKKKIDNVMYNTIFDFMVYDRREDEELYYGIIQKEIIDGNITIEEITTMFKKNMEIYMDSYKRVTNK
jgi:hypothetical protein